MRPGREEVEDAGGRWFGGEEAVIASDEEIEEHGHDDV